MSFVFYDTETTGTNTAFDQILQFAAVKTDHELSEQDRFEIRCRLLPYVVPSPGAMRVTGVTVEQLTDPELPSHYQMVRQIRAKMNEWSPAIFIGHNSMDFDEHLLRQALYKTLHDPYLTNTKGNARSDSLRVLQAVNLYQPNTLSVPVGDTGQPTFKLDMLAPANGFSHVAAHDAMGDVEAMIHLCRIVATSAEGYWSSFVRFAQKAAMLDFADDEEVFHLTDVYFGRTHSWMVTTLGPNPYNGAQLIVFNLAIDPDELADLSDEDLIDRLAARPKPVRVLRANACPCVLAYEDTPEHLRSQASDSAELRARAARIRGDQAFVQRLISSFLATREPIKESPHVEEQLYGEFIDKDDQKTMISFHSADWAARPEIIGQLSDSRLQLLGKRLIWTEAPDVMPMPTRNAYKACVARRLMAAEGTVPWLTLPTAIAKTEHFLTTANGVEAALLRDLRGYLAQRAEEAAALIT